MLYHYSYWLSGTDHYTDFLAKVGIYGVSVFYILSGLTLYYVYNNKLSFSFKSLSTFFLKRFFRIFPLLWLTLFLTLLLNWKFPGWDILFLNLSGLFGIIQIDKYLATGAWSIGNELVFYLFLPLFVVLANKSRILLYIISVSIFSVYCYYAFFLLDPNNELNKQWTTYINPLNQLFLFSGGFLIGHFFNSLKISSAGNILIFFGALTIFILYPIGQDGISIVSGVNRLAFTALCFLICFSFYNLNSIPNKWIDKPLALLGEISYSVYLIHPIIWFLVAGTINTFSKHVFVIPDIFKAIGIPVTFIVAYFIYIKFEKYFMKKGSEVTKKINALELVKQ